MNQFVKRYHGGVFSKASPTVNDEVMGGSVYISEPIQKQPKKLPEMIKNDPAKNFSGTQFFGKSETSSYASVPNLRNQFSAEKVSTKIDGAGLDEINYKKMLKKTTTPKRAVWM